MANETISQLTAGAPAQSTDLLPIARSGSNYSLQVSDVLSAITSADIPNNAANTTGTAANLSGTPALPNGTTATTQSAYNNSTDLGTTAYSDNNFKGASITGFRDDFLGVFNATAGGAVLLMSDTGWTVSKIGTDNGTAAAVAGTFANPGILGLNTGSATSGDGVALYKADAVGCLGILGANAGWEVNIICKLSATTSCAFRAGVCLAGQQAGDSPTDGMWVEYNSANSSSNTDFTWVTASASAYSYATTDSATVDTSFHHFRIRSTAAGTIGFTLDGGTEYTTTTDVNGTGAMAPFVQVLTRTTSGKVLQLDFYSYVAIPGRS